MRTEQEQRAVELRLSAQRALLGNVPATLRAVSIEARGETIFVRSVFVPGATEEDRELLSVAATEIIADFPAPYTIEEEYVELAPPARPDDLRHLVFLRAEPEDDGG